jgi:hypothetical protein
MVTEYITFHYSDIRCILDVYLCTINSYIFDDSADFSNSRMTKLKNRQNDYLATNSSQQE